MEETRKHGITIENRERITISAVEDVESFDEEKVIVETSLGTMTVKGCDFKIHKLNVEDGQLIIEGTIDEIGYSDVREKTSGGFFSRMFQ